MNNRRSYLRSAASVLFIAVAFAISSAAQTSGPDPDSRLVSHTYSDVNEKQRWEINIEYPRIEERAGIRGDKVNAAIRAHVDSMADEFKAQMAEFTDEDRSFLPEGVGMYLEAGYTVEHFGDEYLSVSFGKSTYTGGAHPNHWSSTLNYRLADGRELRLEDLFRPGSGYLKLISELAIADLKGQMEKWSRDDEWITNGAGPDPDNFKSWAISGEGLRFLFDPYQVGPYAAGGFEVTIPFEKFPSEMQSSEFYPVSSISYVGGNPPNWCRNGHFPSQEVEFSIFSVKGSQKDRAYFYGDDGDCPAGTNCRKNSYVIGGDNVIVSREYGGFVCAWYTPAKGNETVGWIEKGLLSKLEVPSSDYDMTGEWVYGESDLSISAIDEDGTLSVKGNSFWRGLGDNIHIGELDHEGLPVNGRLVIGSDEEYDCRVKLTLLGGFLIVSDNKNCGGVNVSFDGIYRRK